MNIYFHSSVRDDDSDCVVFRYDSEYDNYRGGHMTSDAESEFPNEDIDSDVGAVLDELSLENIRQISKNITRKFGARSDREDEDSDAV